MVLRQSSKLLALSSKANKWGISCGNFRVQPNPRCQRERYRVHETMTVGVFQFHSPMEVGGAAVMRVALAHLVHSRYSGLQVPSAPASMAKLGVTPGWQKLEKRALSLSPFSPAQAIQLFSWSFNSLYCQLHNGTNSQPPPTHRERERERHAVFTICCTEQHLPFGALSIANVTGEIFLYSKRSQYPRTAYD